MTDAKTLQHRIEGPQGAPVIVLGPALGTTWHMWDRQIPELVPQWRVLRYDLPGHGGAPADPASSVGELADRLLATLDELGVASFGYVGCSLGGAVGLDLALRHPDRVASLTLISASARFETPDAWRQRGVVVRSGGLARIAHTTPEHWFTPVFRAAQTSIVDWSVQMVRTTDADCYIAACEALAAHDVRHELGRISVPTLVVGGAEDPAAPPADARALVAGIHDARLAVVPGAAHLAPVEQPRAVTELVVRHFSTAWAERPAPAVAAAMPQARPAEPAPEPVAPPADAPPPPAAPPAVRPDPYDEGIRVRREVLGDAHVDRAAAAADDFSADFQEFITRYAWGEVWTRPGLDRKTRSVITLTSLVARGQLTELAFHVRAALRNGLAPAEIREVLIHTAVYAGVPAANSAFAVAQRVIAEETRLPGQE
ncbi:4-carboxymuconolactone decarboxylase [Streptomyces sp. SL13]|uniref:4-carboxymuconolactone decarboxylase n=1 Tax=Streptantibioticus silvisoli TaxID=2705255 RepID=A0AA90KBZ0_9ACTN|nr:4-carboxymuconolactone decarboxylase [Streptantibioticus silvisoli]MDI5967391.1 4-carboxymuconolactone decarboxylase [Streptantibioticus silvisoli]MDI5973947.1 4-carboxymuconolactone decarboxylase [Streptantibioticus silvisoli]